MNRRQLVTLVALATLLALPLAAGQFTADQLKQREAQEEFLRTAEVVSFERVGDGVTKPFKLTLSKDGVESKAAWKDPSGTMLGYWEGWQYEIAAYRLDKLVGLDMVPPAVERQFQGRDGALILWVESKYSLRQIVADQIPIPAGEDNRVNKRKWLTRAWDSLIGNEDRHQGNVLYTEDWRMLLIDHSRAFRMSRKFTERLMYGANGIVKDRDGTPFLFRRLPRSFVENIRALTYDSVKKAVGPYLTDKEIKSLLARRDLLLQEVEAMIRDQGEAEVIYD